MSKNIKHLIPFIFLLCFFLFDKLFLIDEIKNRIIKWDNFDEVNYQAIIRLYEKIYSDPDRKAAFIMGTSRSISMPVTALSSKSGHQVYNLSLPGNSYSNYYYWLHKLLEINRLDIQFIIVEATPLMFSTRANKLPLAHSYNFPFMLHNTALFNPGKGFAFEDLETWALKQLFVLYKYPFSLNQVFSSNELKAVYDKSNKIRMVKRYKLREEIKNNMISYALDNNGSYPIAYTYQAPEKIITAHSLETQKRYIDHFNEDPSQKHFLNLLLETAAKNNIKVILYRPPATEKLRNYLDSKAWAGRYVEVTKNYRSRLQKQYPDYRILYLDPQKDKKFNCDLFIDSHHLNSYCQEKAGKYISGFL